MPPSNENLGLGTATNPLAGTWMQAVLGAAGNYGEAYDDAFCDGTYDGVSGSDAMNGCLISRAGTLNALYPRVVSSTHHQCAELSN